MPLKDELQAAVSARASKTEKDRYSYSDDFNEDEDGRILTHSSSFPVLSNVVQGSKEQITYAVDI